MGRGSIKEGEEEEESEGKRKTWRWPFATLIVVLLAVAVSSRTASNVGFFFSDRNSCSCSLQGTGKYKGMVEDCCCDYETVDNINSEVLNPLLQDLVTTPFSGTLRLNCGVTDHSGQTTECVVVIAVSLNVQRMSSQNRLKGHLSQVFLLMISCVKKENLRELLTVL